MCASRYVPQRCAQGAVPSHEAHSRRGSDQSRACEPVTTKHLNQIELSRRWSISHRTLERWRWLKKGPVYLKIGGRVVYELTAVEDYEAAQRKLDNQTLEQPGRGRLP